MGCRLSSLEYGVTLLEFYSGLCVNYDFIRCLKQLDIILIMSCNVISTGLPLGLFSTDVFWNHSCLPVFIILADSRLFDEKTLAAADVHMYAG